MRREANNTGSPGSGEHPGLTRVLLAFRIMGLAALTVKTIREIVTQLR